MGSDTKIIVLHMKELIYTVIFLALGIVLLILLFHMFTGKGKEEEKQSAYLPGVYAAGAVIGNETVDVMVTIDADHINGVQIRTIDESVETMYPLVQTTVEGISDQIVKQQSLSGLTFDEENQYTATVLMDAVSRALEKAEQ
jgi:uncharacterized protein with FMN-binding domain